VQNAAGVDSVYLVGPARLSYLVARWTSTPGLDWTLSAWSTHSGRLLVTAQNASDSITRAVEVSLDTGAVYQVNVAGVFGFGTNGIDVLSSRNSEISLVAPDGAALGLLDSVRGDVPSGTWNGGVLVSNSAHELSYVTPGGLRRPLDPNGQTCYTVRAWSSSSELASCQRPGSPTSAGFYVLSLVGGAPTPLSLPAARVSGPAASSANGMTSTPVDVYRLPTGTFVTDAGACGSYFVGQQNGATVRQLVAPGVSPDASMAILGTVGDDLLVSILDGCSGTTNVLEYDTANSKWTTMIEDEPGQVGFRSVLQFPA